MTKLQIKQLITDTLNLKNPKITHIRRTPGGMTNDSYFVDINDKGYVIRLPGAGTKELVNRKSEKESLLFGTELGINPPLLYFDTSTGLKITEKINTALSVTPTLAREGDTMKQIIHLFKHLHTTEVTMKNEFKLFDLISHYESLVQEVNDVIIEKLSVLKNDIATLQVLYESLPVQYVPCHIDPVGSNIIKSIQGEMYLIDWEYSGRFDPLWDIATLFISLELREEEQSFFLTHYLGRKPGDIELQRILMHTIFQDYVWCLWSYYKDSQGDNVGHHARMRFERAVENMLVYKESYEDNLVG